MAGGPLRRAVNADSVSIHSFEHIQPRCICFIPAAQVHLTSQRVAWQLLGMDKGS